MVVIVVIICDISFVGSMLAPRLQPLAVVVVVVVVTRDVSLVDSMLAQLGPTLEHFSLAHLLVDAVVVAVVILVVVSLCCG